MLGSAIAQKLDVKIIDRQDKEAAYDYVAVHNNVAVGAADGHDFPSRHHARMRISFRAAAECLKGGAVYPSVRG